MFLIINAVQVEHHIARLQIQQIQRGHLKSTYILSLRITQNTTTHLLLTHALNTQLAVISIRARLWHQAFGRVTQRHSYKILLFASRVSIIIHTLCTKNLNLSIFLKNQNNITSSKLEVTDFIALLQHLTCFNSQLNRRYLTHSNGQDGYMAQEIVLDDHTATTLEPLISRVVRGIQIPCQLIALTLCLDIWAYETPMWTQSVGDRIHSNLQISLSLDHFRILDCASYWSMLTMVIISIEKCMHPDAALKTLGVLCWELLNDVLDIPVETLDIDIVLLVDLPCTIESAVRWEGDQAVVVKIKVPI